MTTEEKIDDLSEKIDKMMKLTDKMMKLTQKIAKSLHLIPVSEKEEREIQLMQRKNLQIAAEVSEQLDEMSPKRESSLPELRSMYDYSDQDVFGDVIAHDFLGGASNG